MSSIDRRHGLGVLLALLAFAILDARPARGQDHCADCHLARTGATADPHLEDWRTSGHAANDVGCSACHGGDPAAVVEFEAHRGVLNSAAAESPTHFRRLPATCGRCHAGLFAAYQKSPHWPLLEAGTAGVPSCSTCHGEAASRSLQPSRLAGRCAPCHGLNAKWPMPQEIERGREVVDGFRALRDHSRKAAGRLRRVHDDARRQQLEAALGAADGLLGEAAEAGHAFDYDRSEVLIARASAAYRKLLADLERP